MGNKIRNIAILVGLGFALKTGYFACQNNSLKKQKAKLETQVELDSINYADLDKKFGVQKGKMSSYADSLEKLFNDNKEIAEQNNLYVQEKEKFEGMYYSLMNKFEKFKKENFSNEKYDSLLVEFTNLKTYANNLEKSNVNLGKMNQDLEKKLEEMYLISNNEKSKSQNANRQSDSSKKSRGLKVVAKSNLLQKMINGQSRLDDITSSSILIKGTDIKNREAFIFLVKTNRKSPLVRLQESGDGYLFGFPEFGNYEGEIKVFTIDKKGKEYFERNIYLKDGKIAKKEKWIR